MWPCRELCRRRQNTEYQIVYQKSIYSIGYTLAIICMKGTKTWARGARLCRAGAEAARRSPLVDQRTTAQDSGWNVSSAGSCSCGGSCCCSTDAVAPDALRQPAQQLETSAASAAAGRDGAAAQHHAGVGARDWVRQYPLGTVPRALPHPVGCTWFGRGERRRCALRLLMAGVDIHDRCAQFKYSSRSASQASLCSRTRVPLKMAAHSRN